MLLRLGTTEVRFAHGEHDLVGDLMLPPGHGPHPLVIAVWGSGPGGRHVYDWPFRFATAGLAFYAYDRPGCGESTGDWLGMDMAGRAQEVLAAVDALAGHPGIDPARVALLGGSQGGWVSPLAAAKSDTVAAVVTFSGPGVSPAAQEEFRIRSRLAAAGLSPEDVVAGVAFLREAYDRLRAGDPADAIVADVEQYVGATSRSIVDEEFDAAELDFLRGILDYDPLPALAAMRCPYLAIFGERDVLVDATESAHIVADTLSTAGHPDYQVVVFPGADHGIRPPEAPQPDSPDTGRSAGFFELIVAWLTVRLPG